MVSNNIANRVLNRVQVIPLTSSTGRVFPSEAVIQLQGQPHKAKADQIRTVAKQRLQGFIDRLSDADMLAVDQAIRVQLGLR